MSNLNAEQQEALEAFDAMRAAIEGERYIYGAGDNVVPGGECWDWLQSSVRTIYAVIKSGWVRGRVRVLITYDEPGGSREGRDA